MRFKIKTSFIYSEIFSHRCEVKTNELINAFQIAKGFVIGSKSCSFFIWAKGCRRKLPNFGIKFSCSDLEKGGILYDIQNFQSWILNIKKELGE